MRAAVAESAFGWVLRPYAFALRLDLAVPVVFAVGRVGYDARLAITPEFSLQQLLLLPLAAAAIEWLRRGFVVRLPGYGLLTALLAISLAVGLVHTDATEYGWSKASHALLWVMVAGAWVAAHAGDPRGVIRILLPLALLGVLLGLLGFALYLREGWSGRLAAIGGGPIVFSRWVGSALVLGFLAVATRRHRSVVLLPWAMLLGGVLFFAVLLAASKGSLLALAVGGVYAYWQAFANWGRGRRLVTLVCVAGALLLVARIVEPAVFLRVLISPMQPEAAGSYGARLAFLEQARSLVAELSPLGLGVGGWAMAVNGVDLRGYPHNLVAELLTEHGWLFGVPILATMAGLGVLAWRRSAGRSEPTVVAVRSLSLFWLVAVSFSGDLVDSRVFFLCLALLEAVSRWPRARPS